MVVWKKTTEGDIRKVLIKKTTEGRCMVKKAGEKTPDPKMLFHGL